MIDKLIKWLTKSPVDNKWEYGYVRSGPARRDKVNGNIQFILWKAGEQGHTEDCWYDFDRSWWGYFQKGEPMADDYICPDCKKEGNSADFIDNVCDECNGEVVTLDEMREIKAQAEEVLKGGSAIGAEMAGKLKGIGEF